MRFTVQQDNKSYHTPQKKTQQCFTTGMLKFFRGQVKAPILCAIERSEFEQFEKELWANTSSRR